MKNDHETLALICRVERRNVKGKLLKEGKLEKTLVKLMTKDIFPKLLLVMLPDEENRQKLKDLNKKLFSR